MDLPRTECSKTPSRNDVKNLFELRIPIIRAGAFMRYIPGSESANLVKEIKYHDGKQLTRWIGKTIADDYSAGKQNFFEGIDVIVPMPLTSRRKRERGYNQAEEMAEGISEVVGIPVDSKSTKRIRFEVSQTLLAKSDREDNVKGAFECVFPEKLSEKHILLVDDVVTTGSTILALADCVLAKAHDVSFSVLSLGITGELKL